MDIVFIFVSAIQLRVAENLHNMKTTLQQIDWLKWTLIVLFGAVLVHQALINMI